MKETDYKLFLTLGRSHTRSAPRTARTAERVGFEPTVPVTGHALSRRAYSTTLAPLHAGDPIIVQTEHSKGGGEGGIRTHDTHKVYRFSRAAPSTTRPPLQ